MHFYNNYTLWHSYEKVEKSVYRNLSWEIYEDNGGGIMCKSFAILICLVIQSFATSFYVDPVNGSNSGDGSPLKPWATAADVFMANLIESQEGASYPHKEGNALNVKNSGAPVKAGDTLLLLSGYHGELSISRYYNSEYITIMSKPGATPVVRNVVVSAAAKWRIQGLTVTPQSVNPYKKTVLVTIESHNYSGPSRDIEVSDCKLYSVQDASLWSMGDWDTLSCNGFYVSAKKAIIRGNYLKNVNFGISVTADSCLVTKNTVENFAGDGLRGLGNYDVFSHNVVMNCYDVNANHDDGFQSWSVGDSGVGTGVVKGIVLSGNIIINYTDVNQPFRGTLQGIGLFDGFFEDWVVENNIVLSDHYHGITFLGARNCRIVNNTVCDINSVTPGPLWIMIGKHKNGELSTGCVIRNNLTTKLTIESGCEVTNENNMLIDNPENFFVDFSNRDLHLKAGCAAIDAGIVRDIPDIDIVGNSRVYGTTVDAGAYEFHNSMSIVNKLCARQKNGMNLPVLMNVYNSNSMQYRGVIYTLSGQKRQPRIPVTTATRNVFLLNGSR
jgi:parallel beta-helix repeat protein